MPIHARLAVTTAEAAIDAAVAGLGMTRVLSYMIEGARRAGELEIVLDGFEPAPWPVNLVYLEKGSCPSSSAPSSIGRHLASRRE